MSAAVLLGRHCGACGPMCRSSHLSLASATQVSSISGSSSDEDEDSRPVQHRSPQTVFLSAGEEQCLRAGRASLQYITRDCKLKVEHPQRPAALALLLFGSDVCPRGGPSSASIASLVVHCVRDITPKSQAVNNG